MGNGEDTSTGTGYGSLRLSKQIAGGEVGSCTVTSQSATRERVDPAKHPKQLWLLSPHQKSTLVVGSNLHKLLNPDGTELYVLPVLL